MPIGFWASFYCLSFIFEALSSALLPLILVAGILDKRLHTPDLLWNRNWKRYIPNLTLPLRVDFGLFNHTRNHTGIFLDVNYGFRRKFKSGLFLEESIGVGVLQSILNSDGVYEVNDEGEVSDGSRLTTLDFMPSVTLGIGYDVSKDTENQNLIWFRPKLYWQLPHKTTSTYNFALQFGFTHTFSINN
jgi:hypothetical protein